MQNSGVHKSMMPLKEEPKRQNVKNQAKVRPDDVFLNTHDHGDTAQVCGAVLCSNTSDLTDSRSQTPHRARALSDHYYKPPTGKGIPASERDLGDRSPSHELYEEPTTTHTGLDGGRLADIVVRLQRVNFL